MKMIPLSDKIACPNSKNKAVAFNDCKRCKWFGGRTAPIKNIQYVCCVMPKEMLEE